MHVHRIALIGANSRIGPAILTALLDSPSKPHIAILLRPSSKPVPSHPRIKTITIPSDPPTTSDLIDVLTGIDSLVCALNPSELETQRRLADACVVAEVGRYIPADYGSVRSDDPVVLDFLPNFRNKQLVREHCQRLAEENPEFTWTSLITGHFFDYGLRTELLGFDLEKGKAMIFDGGGDRWSTSTVGQIGRAVAAVLEKDDESTANRILLVQSFCVTQLEVLEAIESVRGSKSKLTRKEVRSKEYIEEKGREVEKGDLESVEELVAVLGIKRANWKGKEEFANELLGLEEENLEDVVAEILRDMVR